MTQTNQPIVTISHGPITGFGMKIVKNKNTQEVEEFGYKYKVTSVISEYKTYLPGAAKGSLEDVFKVLNFLGLRFYKNAFTDKVNFRMLRGEEITAEEAFKILKAEFEEGGQK